MRKKWLLVVGAVLVAVIVAACGGSSGNTKTLVNNANEVNGDLKRLQAAEPLPTLHDSAALRIQDEYYTAQADPDKIWYLETLSYTGSVEASYTIRGGVENLSDQTTNPEQPYCESPGGYSPSCTSIGLAEPNGVYESGDSNDHIAILADGAILQFEGPYQTSDQPFSIHTPVAIQINGSAPISHTNLHDSTGGVVPQTGGAGS